MELQKTFVNPNPGGNFSFGAGMAIAIEIEKTSPGVLRLDGTAAEHGLLRIADVELDFVGKAVNDDVTV